MTHISSLVEGALHKSPSANPNRLASVSPQLRPRSKVVVIHAVVARLLGAPNNKGCTSAAFLCKVRVIHAIVEAVN